MNRGAPIAVSASVEGSGTSFVAVMLQEPKPWSTGPVGPTPLIAIKLKDWPTRAKDRKLKADGLNGAPCQAALDAQLPLIRRKEAAAPVALPMQAGGPAITGALALAVMSYWIESQVTRKLLKTGTVLSKMNDPVGAGPLEVVKLML